MERPPSKSTVREVAEAAVVGAAGAVPVVGSPFATALGLALGWAYSKRMQQWLDDLADAVEELRERVEGVPLIEELATNEGFLDLVVYATRAAQATHNAEKLAALRNAIINSLGPDAPSTDEQARFVRLVDEFTGAHLRLLAFLADPRGAFDAAGRQRPHVTGSCARGWLLVHAMPEFAGRPEWCDLLMSDLRRGGLTNEGSLQEAQDVPAPWQSGINSLGRRFLAFVTTY